MEILKIVISKIKPCMSKMINDKTIRRKIKYAIKTHIYKKPRIDAKTKLQPYKLRVCELKRKCSYDEGLYTRRCE
jgi:hypothetical protein